MESHGEWLHQCAVVIGKTLWQFDHQVVTDFDVLTICTANGAQTDGLIFNEGEGRDAVANAECPIH